MKDGAPGRVSENRNDLCHFAVATNAEQRRLRSWSPNVVRVRARIETLSGTKVSRLENIPRYGAPGRVSENRNDRCHFAVDTNAKQRRLRSWAPNVVRVRTRIEMQK